MPAISTLENGLHPVLESVLSGAFPTAGAIAGFSGGGVIGAIVGGAAGGAIDAIAKGSIAKLSATRSGRYAIEKAVQEATKAVKVGASDGALAAAERRFMANKAAVKSNTRGTRKRRVPAFSKGWNCGIAKRNDTGVISRPRMD